MSSSGMLRRVALVRSDVSEVLSVYIIRVILVTPPPHPLFDINFLAEFTEQYGVETTSSVNVPLRSIRSCIENV
jgi:hypothetical protein